MKILPQGVRHIPGIITIEQQRTLIDCIRTAVAEAPFYVPVMPRSGTKMSVQMTNCGALGWVTDQKNGYRYQAEHPKTGKKWPPIPDMLLDLWTQFSGYMHPPEACLINYYNSSAKMSLHQDKDEENLQAPVVSVSLGDDCLFRIGEKSRGGRTTSIRLKSGDIIVLGGEGRLCYHGVDRIYPDTSALLRHGGRINLTLRRVKVPSG